MLSSHTRVFRVKANCRSTICPPGQCGPSFIWPSRSRFKVHVTIRRNRSWTGRPINRRHSPLIDRRIRDSARFPKQYQPCDHTDSLRDLSWIDRIRKTRVHQDDVNAVILTRYFFECYVPFAYDTFSMHRDEAAPAA